MKNYVSISELIDIYKISHTIVDTILKKYKIDTFKAKKWLLINFKDFHKAYTSVYNPSLFSVLDKKAKKTPRKPEEVEELLEKRKGEAWIKQPNLSLSMDSIFKKYENANKNLFI